MLERSVSLFGFFPFLCGDCEERFYIYGGREEGRRRKRLRALAAQSEAALEAVSGDNPPVLVTVKTAGNTRDLIYLLDHLASCEERPDWCPDAPMIVVRPLEDRPDELG